MKETYKTMKRSAKMTGKYIIFNKRDHNHQYIKQMIAKVVNKSSKVINNNKTDRGLHQDRTMRQNLCPNRCLAQGRALALAINR